VTSPLPTCDPPVGPGMQSTCSMTWASLDQVVRPRPALLPPLREDIRQRALQTPEPGTSRRGGGKSRRRPGATERGHTVPEAEWRKGRRFLSGCVRLSPEKNADLFASLVEHLAPFLGSHGIVPLLCAGANSENP